MFTWFEQRIDPYQDGKVIQPPAKLWPFYWFFCRQIWPLIAVSMTLGLIGSLIEVALFAYLGGLVDRVKDAPDAATFFAENSGFLLAMAATAMLLRPIVFIAHALVINQGVIPSFTNLIRWQAHRYVLRQSLHFFQNDFAGRIANKIMQTGPAIRESLIEITDSLWFVAIYAVSALVLFAQSDWRLTIPLALWIIAFIAVLIYFVPKIQHRSAIASEARSTLTGRIVDSYTNIQTIKLFAHTDREDRYARAAMVDNQEKFQSSMRLISAMEMTIWCMNGVLITGTTGVALWLWGQSLITIGAIALTVGLVIRINNMSEWVMWVVTSIFENIGTVQEGMESIAKSYAVVDQPDARPLKTTQGAITFEHIHFHYGKDDGVISDLSLAIKAGEKVGLVGRSGAGKSTLVNLLLRFYDLEAGRIAIDGQDIAGVTQQSLRASIGMVTQDTSLLHRSVLDNIIYGRPDVDRAAAIDAAKRAHAHDFIQQLEDGKGRQAYDAHVGERGVTLSGGQRQRIAIARVLLKNAPILILDEATSALDSEVEAAIQEQLSNLMQGKTVIAIAHRLSTIAAMDRLVIMDQGQIIEQGSHLRLLDQQGLYAELWARQSGGFLAVDELAS